MTPAEFRRHLSEFSLFRVEMVPCINCYGYPDKTIYVVALHERRAIEKAEAVHGLTHRIIATERVADGKSLIIGRV